MSQFSRLFSNCLLCSGLLWGVGCGASESGVGEDSSHDVDTRAPADINKVVDDPSIYFISVLDPRGDGTIDSKEALRWIDENWSERLLPYYLEIHRFLGRSAPLSSSLDEILLRHTDLTPDFDYDELSQYVWEQNIMNEPAYAQFKQNFYAQIDPRFREYFYPDREFQIRLDEVVWGGVRQDGIPPLRSPRMLSAGDADYLADSDAVFGIEINGDFRAYPKRILAWHEMFVDEVGGVDVAGVYCTLCGTVVIYETSFDGVNHQLGTSGFLYRSNKLMYDRATDSLWSTLEGKPVIGPLVGQGIELAQHPVVTTTWGEWRSRHPETQVLSLNTGHNRDYGEGVAYHSYFATDERMFETPFKDDRLKNKDEVLALRFIPQTEQAIAIDENLLRSTPIYEAAFGGQEVVILTDRTGANRVYERKESQSFEEWDQKQSVVDKDGLKWELTEQALLGPDNMRLERLPAHRAFWFGWQAAYPETVLIQ